MRLLAYCYCGVKICLCLTLCGCSSATKFLSRTADQDSKWHATEPVNSQTTENKPTEVVAKLMKEWECEIPNDQLGDYAQQGYYSTKVENAEQWSRLWNRWQPDKLVPDVDFKSSLVYVRIDDVGDPNSIHDNFRRQTDGTVWAERVTTCVGFAPTNRSRIHFSVVQRN